MPVVALIESPAGVAVNESGLYLRANISYSYSISDCVNSCANIRIGPNSPVNFPKPFTPLWVCWFLPKITSPGVASAPVGVP